MFRFWFARLGAVIVMTIIMMSSLSLQAASSAASKPSRALLVSIGQNLSWASRSDIHFQGSGYDFTLHDVASHDDLQLDYRPDRTQYVIRALYYWSPHFFVGLGMNHMKYIIDSQSLRMTGAISSEVSEQYGRSYDEDVHVGAEGNIVEVYDHTDGVNFYDIQVGTTRSFWESSAQEHRLTASGSVSVGFLWPRTKEVALNQGKNQPYHISGYGGAVSAVARYHYRDTFFIDFALKTGWLNYVNAYSFEPEGHTSQSYWFIEPMLTAGIPFQL